MSYTAESLQDIDTVHQLIADVENGNPETSVLDALELLSEAGYLFIGTSDLEPIDVHQPRENPVFKNMFLGSDVLLEEPGRSLLQATFSGKIAVLHAICGDINLPGQRTALGKSFGDFGNNYGWRSMEPDDSALPYFGAEAHIQLHADRRLFRAIERQPRDPTRVAIIRADGSHFTPSYALGPEGEPALRFGIVVTEEPQIEVASMPVLGRDIHRLDLWQRDPKDYESAE